ncbi:hypothetical protein M011DRAFT_394370 [Sporormia fimetaria CBS 119925]|uniref:FHA domain-containing protein n=1 Tax=Sporormia fimetaria CBS 119925 TaxID=1340428 RepID=A0A6A6VRA7_9PLEO|nr:hypothetical protein M011DRAFT_394370 [Sporormia fimetaria CBS 119925]
MWLLEHETLFEGKRLWLRPGSQHLFGRTSSSKGEKNEDAKNVSIPVKAVSRQHLMLKVLDVQAGDGTKLHTRSKIEITDLSCRQGTVIDGTRKLLSTKDGNTYTAYDKAVLEGTEHRIRLVHSYPEFKVTWHPVVFTFASKDGRDRAPKLHTLDIKTSSEFVHDHTTHVVTMKRNLPRVLQGLTTARHVVTPKFLDALVSVATPQVGNPEEYAASNLEEDFNAWWPKEADYLPPIGAEPVKRPAEVLKPNTDRATVFSGLTFVFLNENQYNSLSEPIFSGGGKALFFNLQFGETTVDKYVDYVRNTAGEKSRNSERSARLPVVTIRFSSYPEGMEEWAVNFLGGVDQALNQRSVQQNELLDAILMVDTSSLRRLPEMVSDTPVQGASSSMRSGSSSGNNSLSLSAPPSQPAEPSSTPAPAAEEPAKLIPRKRPIRRGVTQSRFTGFDDYELPPKARKTEEDSVMVDAQESVPRQTQASALESQEPITLTQVSRPHQSQVVETVEKLDPDELFPAAAALRKRRAAAVAAAERDASASLEPQTATTQTNSKIQLLERAQKAKSKAIESIDVREETKRRVQAEAEKRQAEEESLRQGLEGVEISDIRPELQIEEMPVMQRQRQRGSVQPNQGAANDRWNDEWNGRKNFKRFRRRGAQAAPQPRRTLIAVQEVPPKRSFGLGDTFFLEEHDSSRRSEQRQEERRRVPTQTQESESEPEQGFTRNRRRGRPEVINVEDSANEAETQASTSTLRSRTQRVAETQMSEPRTTTHRKRPPAAAAPAGQPASKRSRPARTHDDSDAEETGFRLRRRR